MHKLHWVHLFIMPIDFVLGTVYNIDNEGRINHYFKSNKER